ncbi:putative ribonuclease H-like domain-containing protein [Tanacetum coccineum]|uniref:Ribonuclease H-like domain-containing protein n=1 Tax=Tanacetum coccineum TaxID=301880 RepID=A0ABQ5D5K9_9ASTR
MVAQGHRQEEGINYDELDVKSAFLYGEIEEEVYVTQPKGFEDPYFPKHVYRVVKALYGLHQAPRAWYARLSAFLLQHNYRRGTIDKTLFIKKDSRDILLQRSIKVKELQERWTIKAFKLSYQQRYEHVGPKVTSLQDGENRLCLVDDLKNNALAKLPMLKLGDYEMWEIRIKQYFQIQDYALWDVIENGNSWVSVPVTTTPENGTLTTKMIVLATAEEKTCKKNEVKARTQFGGNEATKKTQKALLKQQYENFNASSSESLDSIFNRLQKLVSRLAILGMVTLREDLNLKFLRSLPAEWDTYVVVWMNKPDFETMGLDDLYNNFKIVEQKVKKSTGGSNGDKNLVFVTTSGPSSTNNTNTANSKVSTVSTNVITASTEITTASINDAIIYAFLSNQRKGSQLVHEDLEQLHDDDLEEMDLKWNMALLSMRARKFYQRTRRKIIIDGSNTVGYDKSKVECFNCHNRGHFARECRALRNKDNRNWNQGSLTKTVKIEDTSEKAMMAIDSIGFDWSDMAKEQVQINMALMAFSDSEVYTDKTCLKNYEYLKKQCDDLLVKLNDSEFKIATYKKGLATLEDQIVTYKKNEILFSEEVVVFKRELGCKQYEIGVFRTELEKVKQKKEGIDFKIAKFDKAVKSLDEMLASQISDKSKKDLGYNVVAPPHLIILNAPTKLDLSYSESENSEENIDDSLEKQQVFDNESSSVESPLRVDKETIIDWKEKFFHPANHVELVKSKKKEKLVKRTVRYAEIYRSPCPRGNQRNWNGQKSNQLDYDYYAKSNTHKNMTPRAALLRNGLKPLNTARPVYTAHPRPTIHSARPQPRVVNTARPYATSVNTIKENGFNAVKPSACWGNPKLNDKGFLDSGCSRHMTGNLAYLLNFKEFDGGNVTFGGGAYGGRLSGKGTLKTNNLDFEDVYFVNELKFNLFSVSQMCDKKNYVLFTDSECLVLSPDFKSPDKNQILLRIPREDSMYSFNMHNIVAKDNLTYLVAKTTTDESMLWHRRLGHINFKNINKLVKENLVRGLLLKCFKNDQTCVSCLKGKQHRASCKSKLINPITKPLFMLHMDLFGPTFMGSLMHKKYCLVTTNDFSRFTWIFFLAAKDETSEILKNFIKELENLVDKKVKIIRSDNGTEFKNRVMDDFSKRRNRTLIEAARTMLADSKLPTTFWAEVVEDGLNNEFDDKDDNNSFKEDTTAGQQVNTASPGVNTAEVNTVDPTVNTASPKDMLGDNNPLEATHVEFVKDEDKPEVELGNIPNSYAVPTTPHIRIYKNHPPKNIIGDIQSSVQTRRSTSEQGFLKLNRVTKSLSDPAWVEAMQEELLQFKLQKVWILVDLPKGKRPIGVKWIFKNKTDKRGIVIRNKARLVAQGYTQEKGIEYDDVFALVARIEAIRLFLAYASFMGFMAYQMDVKSAFLYGTIEEEVYVCQPLGFKDTDFLDKVYKVVKALYVLHQAPRACHDKYVTEILRKFNYIDVKTGSITIDLEKPFVKDRDVGDVDVHLYRSMIGSLMYLTASRPDIMFALWILHLSKFLTNSDYAGATQDGKSTTGGCQFLGSRLISWQCMKQTIVVTSTTEAEYVATASCYLLTNGFDAGSTARTAEATTGIDEEVKITATIDGHSKTISKASLRIHLKLEDNDVPTKGYSGVEVDLFPAMLNVPSPEPLPEPSPSPSRITSSPSQSSEPTPDHTTTTAPSSSEPQHP